MVRGRALSTAACSLNGEWIAPLDDLTFVPSMSCRGCTGCVLIVEDDADTLAALREIVARLGCRVVVAQDGIDALDRLRSAPAAPCLVLTDLNMPRLDGAGFAAYLRHVAAYADTPLVTMSAGRVVRALPDVDAHLVKPFAAADLCRRIARLCPGGPAQQTFGSHDTGEDASAVAGSAPR